MTLAFQFNDGGRATAGITGSNGDCVTRAIAIATGMPYRDVYRALKNAHRHQVEIERKRALEYGIAGGTRPSSTPLTGLTDDVFVPYLRWLGWDHVIRPLDVDGKPLRLRDGALPMGRLIVQVSRHLVAVIDGVIHDTYNSAGAGRRPIRGYFHNPE